MEKVIKLGRVPNAYADAFVDRVRELLLQYAPDLPLELYLSDGSTEYPWSEYDEYVWQIAKGCIDVNRRRETGARTRSL